MSLINKQVSCCVIGAGVSGLSSAIELSKRGFQVVVLSDEDGDDLTSAAAAAFWYPFWTGKKPDHSWYRPTWAWNTFLSLQEFTSQAESGVTWTQLNEYFDSSLDAEDIDSIVKSMWWRGFRSLEFRELGKKELVGFTSFGRTFSAGVSFRTLVINMRAYLPFLRNILLDLGVTFEKRHITKPAMEELCKHFDVVLNCSGLGARDLADDRNLTPREGIVVRMPAISGVDSILLAHTGVVFGVKPVYVVPRGGPDPDIILGGTIDGKDGNPRTRTWIDIGKEEWAVRRSVDTILGGCQELEPQLRAAEPIGFNVGYRPSREPAVRVEPEFERQNLIGRLFHNYGHGGGGITLSWGCAKEIAIWIDWFLSTDQ
jgi:D-amino-acid oxidase